MAVEPGAGEGPVALNSPAGDAKCRRGFVERQSGEEPELDQFGPSGIDKREPAERGVEVDQVVGRGVVIDKAFEVKPLAFRLTTTLDPLAVASAVDENPPHRLGGGGEEVAPTVPRLDRVRTDQPHIRLMNQGSGLERLPRHLAGKPGGGKPTEFVINERQYLRSR